MNSTGKLFSRAYLPVIAFFFLAAFTVFTFFYAHRLELANAEIRFQQASADRAAAVQRQFELSIAAVDVVGTFFDTRPGVSEQEFQRFVGPILARNPALSGLSYAPLVDASVRDEFEAQSAAAHPGFLITERLRQGEMVAAANRPSYTPVRYIVPLAGNEAALGFDLASDSARSLALTAARRANAVRATGPVILVQETDAALSFLLARPVYSVSQGLTTTTAGDAVHLGYITAVVRSGRLLQSALLQLQPAGVDFEIYDISARQQPVFLVAHQSRTRNISGNSNDTSSPAYMTSTEFQLAGRRYRIELSSVPQAFVAHIGLANWGLLLVGLAFALAIAVLLGITRASELQQQKSADALRTLSQRLINVQENERARLSHEIHDEIGQAITAVKLNLHALGDATKDHAKQNILDDSNNVLDRILHQVRDISLDLRPPMLDDLGLDAALGWYLKRQVARASLQLNYTFDKNIGRLPKSLETSVFRIVQEATTNVIRHAEADSITVSVAMAGQDLEVSIADDGQGLLAATGLQDDSNLLRGLRQRTSLSGGTLVIDSAPGGGTKLVGRFPLANPS